MEKVNWHKNAINRLVTYLQNNYMVKAPYNLPVQNRFGALYQPDICVFDKYSEELKCIIEVQTANVRKSIMGAAILAEISLKDLNLSRKIKLIFILKDNSNQEELRKLVVRLKKMKDLFKLDYLDENIELLSFKEFMESYKI